MSRLGTVISALVVAMFVTGSGGGYALGPGDDTDWPSVVAIAMGQ